jgi:hypothetical protein
MDDLYYYIKPTTTHDVLKEINKVITKHRLDITDIVLSDDVRTKRITTNKVSYDVLFGALEKYFTGDKEIKITIYCKNKIDDVVISPWTWTPGKTLSSFRVSGIFISSKELKITIADVVSVSRPKSLPSYVRLS